MTDKVNKFIESNASKIIILLAAIIVLWLNSKYESKIEADKLRIEVANLKSKITLVHFELDRLKDRFDKKLKIQCDNTEKINNLKIDYAVIKNSIENLNK